MGNKKIFKRISSVVMVLVTIVGITTVHVQKSKANEVSNNTRERGEAIVCTDTLDKYWNDLETMSVEEFESIFYSEAYQREFYRNYEMVKRGESTFDKLKQKASLITDKYIDMVTENLFEKMPKLIKDKISIDKEQIKTIVKTVAQYLDKNDTTITTVMTVIGSLTGWKLAFVKPVLDMVFKLLDVILSRNKDEEPTVQPTDVPSQEPSEEPADASQQPDVEPTNEPFLDGLDELDDSFDGMLDCPPQMDTTQEPFLEDCPPRPEVTEQPQPTEVPASEPEVTQEPIVSEEPVAA